MESKGKDSIPLDLIWACAQITSIKCLPILSHSPRGISFLGWDWLRVYSFAAQFQERIDSWAPKGRRSAGSNSTSISKILVSKCSEGAAAAKPGVESD